MPSVRDRVTERAIAAVLVPQVDPHLQPDSFGFRPGLGVADAVRTLQDRVDEGEETPIDPYAAEAPEEFFAVASEYHFSAPELLAREMPAVARHLLRFYGASPIPG